MEATQRVMYSGDVIPRPAFLTNWERTRHSKSVHWFVECFAEALGVFFYCYAGIGATAPFVIGGILGEETIGSLLQVGFGYAFGILLAVAVCSATSGGHFSPSITLVHIIFRKFPVAKGIRYIIAQIIGAYIASLLVYVQWRDMILLAEGALKAAGKYDAIQFTPLGTAGIFGLYINHGLHLGNTFVNEFVTDFVLGLAIWACLDPTNVLVPPQAAPFIISFAYAAAIWGFAIPGLALNTARDLGGRFAAMTIWGSGAAGGSYAAVAALTNIPATLLAVLVYELMLSDSDRVLPSATLEYLRVHTQHRRNPESVGHSTGHDHSSLSNSSTHKRDVDMTEHSPA
ncbi:hypothetical protein HGRIS_003934 [Hohenbuehelia grisea]|uniref:Aquaporin-like protein n=1 Tax=Hohenbuehelia grisea TaxID=104357 RepID=A0ABR3JHL5_9AGAR